MKMPFLPLKRLVVVTLAGLGFASLLMPQPSLADDPSDTITVPTYDPQNNITDPYNTNTNPFSTQDGGGFGAFDLIHRAT